MFESLDFRSYTVRYFLEKKKSINFKDITSFVKKNLIQPLGTKNKYDQFSWNFEELIKILLPPIILKQFTSNFQELFNITDNF